MQEDLLYWRLRAQFKNIIRNFFSLRGHEEIDTPMLVQCPGAEVHLEYFKTEWRDFAGGRTPLWLRSSPEIHMKKALAYGMPKIFQMAPSFRNGGEISDWHHPEFLMLEWYTTGLSFEGLMDFTEELLRYSHAELKKLPYTSGLQMLTLPAKIERVSVQDAVKRYTGITLHDGDASLAAKARASGVISVQPNDDFETAFFKIMLERVEVELAKKTVVALYDYPPSQAALATVRDGAAKRCEFYVQGVELSNGFEELLGREPNAARLAAINSERRKLTKEEMPEDQEFLDCLAIGIEPCVGNALGLDRCLALFLGQTKLDRIIPFRRRSLFYEKNSIMTGA